MFVRSGSMRRRHGVRVIIAVPVDFADVPRHMMRAGGKRFRAMLVLLAARFGDCRDKRIVPAAVAIELTHLATLFHDDLLDEAAIRRGQPSANSRFGNSIAILAGDY